MFSQFYAASMFVNPALAGDKQNMNFTIQHRTYTNQYSKYNLSQMTALVPLKIKYFNTFFRRNHSSGAAFTMYRSSSGKEGELTSIGFLGTFAQNVQILKSHYVAVGLQTGYVNLKQGDNFMWGTQYDVATGYDKDIIPSIGDIDIASHFPTINAGAAWFMNNTNLKSYMQKYRFDAFGGIAAYNINRPNTSFFDNEKTKLPINWKVHGGVKTFFNQRFYLYPNVIYLRQNNNSQFMFGAYATYKPTDYNDEKGYNAIFGLWYRVGESVVASVGSAYYNVKFALSYDFLATNKFSFSGRGKGALEFSVRYTMPSKKQHLSRGQVYPSF